MSKDKFINNFKSLSKEEKVKRILSLTPEEQKLLLDYPELFLHNKQIIPEGNWRYLLLMCGRGFGKMQDLNTVLPTPTGFIQLKSLKVGDKLFDENGDICHVIQLHPIDYSPKSYKLTFNDNTTTIACADHLWLTYTKSARKSFKRAKYPQILPSIVTTEQIFKTLKVGKKQEYNHSIPATKPVKYSNKDLPIDPYVLGCWLGDGNSSTKHIPEQYLYSSIEQRMSLLQGLLDTDGCCSKKGNIEYCTVIPELADQVLQLTKSLGIISNLHKNKSFLYGKRCKDRYRITFITHLPVFRLKRKLDNIKNNITFKNTHRYITKCELVKSVPMRCITVDSPNNLFLCTDSFIPTHNTTTGSAYVAQQIKQGVKSVGLCGSKYSDVKQDMIPGILKWFSPDVIRKLERNDQDHIIKFPNNAVIKYYSSDTEIRGPNLELLWVDEICKFADSIPEKVQECFDLLDMTVRVGANPKVIITSTPKSFPFFTKFSEQIKNNNPAYKLISGTMFDNPFLPKSFINTMLEKHGNTRLGRQELYGELLTDTPGALWTYSLFDETRVSAYPQLSRIVVAVDPAVTSNKDSDETGIIVAGLGIDNHVYVLEDVSGKYSPLDWAKTVIRVFNQYKADKIIAEKNNGGDLVATNIRSVAHNAPIKIVHASKGKITRAEPVAALYEQKKVHHIKTFQQLEDQCCSYSGDPKQPSPDRLDALCWAVTELLLNQNSTIRDSSWAPYF